MELVAVFVVNFVLTTVIWVGGWVPQIIYIYIYIYIRDVQVCCPKLAHCFYWEPSFAIPKSAQKRSMNRPNEIPGDTILSPDKQNTTAEVRFCGERHGARLEVQMSTHDDITIARIYEY